MKTKAFTQAPIVKWLSQPSYERLFWVQFPVGAIFILFVKSKI